MKKTVLPILAATGWISISEFVRNEFFLKKDWVSHYENMGLVFPSEPVNGAVWGLWSLLLAIAIYILSKKFNLLQTAFFILVYGLCVSVGSCWEYGCASFQILYFAIPLSLLETYIASWIIHKLSN
ncbi:MAG: hypothetical protein R2792_03245 [Saprospiraceae bacterium]